MKALKILLAIIVAVVIIFLVASALAPATCHVERSIVINTTAQNVFGNVNIISQWKNWSFWMKLDTAQTLTFSGPPSGVGSSYSWDGKKTKQGTLTITESNPPQNIKTELDFKEQGKAESEWKFETVDSSTKVTLAFNSELKFFERLMPGLMMDKFLGKAFEEDLAGLKKFSESAPLPPITPAYAVQMVNVSPQWVITLRDTTSVAGISASLQAMYGRITDYIKTKNLTAQDYPLAIWHKFDAAADICQIEAGIPVADSTDVAKGMRLIKKGGESLKVTHWGAYTKSAAAYEALTNYLKQSELVSTGAPWEVYITNPMTEPDTAKWQTDIYFPL